MTRELFEPSFHLFVENFMRLIMKRKITSFEASQDCQFAIFLQLEDFYPLPVRKIVPQIQLDLGESRLLLAHVRVIRREYELLSLNIFVPKISLRNIFIYLLGNGPYPLCWFITV